MECLLAAIWWDKGAIVAAHPPYPPQTKASNPGWAGGWHPDIIPSFRFMLALFLNCS
jgi:hypothetical protein